MDEIHQSVDFVGYIEHGEGHANAVAFRRDAYTIAREIRKPVVNREIEDVDVRAMFLPTRSDETDADLVDARDQMVAEIENVLLDVLDADLIESCTLRDRRSAWR